MDRKNVGPCFYVETPARCRGSLNQMAQIGPDMIVYSRRDSGIGWDIGLRGL
jgi:hypothetical protein